jgi:hypothetical protein
VHRDVKPDNIMIRNDGRVVVVDFGVAKPVSSAILVNAETVAGVTAKSLTAQGQLIGTPAYLAPEQARGVDVGPATDQFALAVTAFEALSGKLPWKGDGVVEIVASLLRDESPPVSSNADVPPVLDPVLERALAKDPKDRWPDLGAFADAFEAAASTLLDSPRSSKPSKRGLVVRTPQEVAPAVAKTASPTQPTPVAISSTKAFGADRQRIAAIARDPPSRGRVIGVIAAIGAIGAIAWLAATGRLGETKASSAPSSSSSAAALGGGLTSAYACPPFEAATLSETWLGAAAAALACERLQITHGGLDARTIVPAQLLDIGRELTQATPVGIYDAEARQKSIVAAKQRADRWLDGKIDQQGAGFTVTIVLRADAREIARGEGRGVELFEAVRSAVEPIVKAEPPSAAELATMREELDTSSIEDAFAVLDVHTAVLVEDPVSLKEVCFAAAARTTLAPRVAYLVKSMCAKKLRTGAVADPPPPIDESTVGALLTTSLAHGTMGGPAAVRDRAARLEAASGKAATAEAQSRLSAAAAELYNSVGDERGRQRARIAIQSSAKAYDWRVSTWHRLAFSSEADLAIAGAIQAWQPWEPVAQSLRGVRSTLTDAGANAEVIKRAYLLSQRGIYAQEYGRYLLMQGKVESARALAEIGQDDLLRVNVLLGEAKYGAAFATVPRIVHDLPSDDEHAGLAFQLAEQGATAATILERPADFVGELVTKWVAAEPHHVIDGVVPFNHLVTACCLAPRPTGKQCIERLQQLRADGKVATIFAGSDTVLAGAARWVVDDYPGAAKAWRTLLRAPGWIQDPLRDVMAIAFDRAGAPELADEVDAPTVALVDLPRTAALAWVRSAKRAEKRGDRALARKLAQAVVDKWRFADEDIPAVREMRQLVARLPAP